MGFSSLSTATQGRRHGMIVKQIKGGKMPDEYIISINLHIMNEESDQTTFQSRRGSSNIDVTVVNNQLLNALHNWKSAQKNAAETITS